jgi:hypothetical protein
MEANHCKVQEGLLRKHSNRCAQWERLKRMYESTTEIFRCRALPTCEPNLNRVGVRRSIERMTQTANVEHLREIGALIRNSGLLDTQTSKHKTQPRRVPAHSHTQKTPHAYRPLETHRNKHAETRRHSSSGQGAATTEERASTEVRTVIVCILTAEYKSYMDQQKVVCHAVDGSTLNEGSATRRPTAERPYVEVVRNKHKRYIRSGALSVIFGGGSVNDSLVCARIARQRINSKYRT